MSALFLESLERRICLVGAAVGDAPTRQFRLRRTARLDCSLVRKLSGSGVAEPIAERQRHGDMILLQLCTALTVE